MLMGIDVGNTNITFGIFDNHKLKTSFRMRTTSFLTSDEIGVKIKIILSSNGFENKISNIIISSVVPEIMNSLVEGVKNYLNINPIVLKNDMDFGINMDIDCPKEVGVDRIVDLVAAKSIYGYPCIVVDFGTATTYDLLDENSSFIAGVTSPGIKTALYGLIQKAAQLSNIEIKAPKSILAKNTADSINAGVVLGQIGQARYIISKLQEEANIKTKVVITGGLARLLKDDLSDIAIYDTDLTLYGLKIIFDRLNNENR